MCGFFPLEFECVESQIFEQSYNHFNYADFGAGQPDYRMSRSVVQIDPVSWLSASNRKWSTLVKYIDEVTATEREKLHGFNQNDIELEY